MQFTTSIPIARTLLLIIPFRHFESCLEATKEEEKEMTDLLIEAKDFAENNLKPAAYNINLNNGRAAGQVIMHAHIHLIPRY